MPFATGLGLFGNTNERRGGTPSTNGALTWTGGTTAGTSQSNTQVQFGNSSLFGNAASRINTVTSTTGLNFGLADFTVEGWNYIPTARTSAQNAIPFCSETAQGIGIRYGNNGGSDTNLNQLQCFKRSGADGEFCNITWPRNQWNHWVVQRTGGGTSAAVITFWVNGVKQVTLPGRTSNVANTSFANVSSINMGAALSTTEALRGIYLDEVSVTNGFARYDTVGNIVVPIEPNIVDNSTGLLMHFDNGNGNVTFNNATV
jgi:hypothetical protein